MKNHLLLPFAVLASSLSALAGDAPTLPSDWAISPLTLSVNETAGRVIDADGVHAVAGSSNGKAVIFRKGSSGWIEEQRLIGSSASGFGMGVRLHGSTIFVSEHLNSDVVTEGGAVHVWVRNGTNWTPETTLRPSDPAANEKFGGAAQATSRFDLWGDWAAVGSPSKDGTGAVYVFERSGTTWTEQAKLGPPLPGLAFGGSVELDDRSLAVRSTMGWQVYRRVGGQWIWLQTLTTPQGENPSGQVSLRGDRIAVNRSGPNDLQIDIFRYAGTSWVHESEFVAEPLFPTANVLRLEIDGNRLGVATTRGVLGSVPVFEEDAAGQWRRIAMIAPLHVGCEFGSGGLVFAGDQLVIGYPWSWPPENPIFSDNGTVEFVTFRPAPASFCTGKLNSDGCVAQIDFCGLPGAGSQFDVTTTGTVGQKPSILFYGYAPTAVPLLGGTLCVAPPLRRTAIQLGGGDATPCSGTNTFDFAAVISSGADPQLVADAQIYCQYWYRDPGDADGVGLTNALSFTIWP